MAVQIARRLFTVSEFEKMIRDGILKDDERIELIKGEIVEMRPINHPHAALVSKLDFLFREALGKRAYVWSQNPIWLDRRNRPQPDGVLLKWRNDFYHRKRPTAADVLLVVEVADSSLGYDRKDKSALYAEAGIPEYWIVNVKDEVIEVYSGPANGRYGKSHTASGKEILPLPGLQASIQVNEVFDSE
jgi:Uma2 family endonuclease